MQRASNTFKSLFTSNLKNFQTHNFIETNLYLIFQIILLGFLFTIFHWFLQYSITFH